MSTYTLVAYKANGSSRNCGRGCCGSTDSDSDHMLSRGLSLEQLAEEIAKLRIQFDPEAHREDYRGPDYEVTYFDDTAGADWDLDDVSTRLEKLISEQEPIIKQREALAAKEKAEREAEAERVRAAKYAAEQREKKDKEEFARLSAKFGQVKP